MLENLHQPKMELDYFYLTWKHHLENLNETNKSTATIEDILFIKKTFYPSNKTKGDDAV